MSIQWVLVAGVMYIELTFTVILILPFISPQRWNRFFKSSFLRSICNMSSLYFKIFLGILVLLFMDAIREMNKYSGELVDQQKGDHGVHLDSDLQIHMKLFRAQRNFYISGFALFLWVVLQRLTSLISRLAVTQVEKEAAIKQAESASQAASSLMKENKKRALKEGKKSPEGSDDDDQKENNLTNELKELREENRKLKIDHEAALRQASSVSNEYDRLMEEHTKLQEELKTITNESGSKKAD